jgi:hypothetical protein
MGISLGGCLAPREATANSTRFSEAAFVSPRWPRVLRRANFKTHALRSGTLWAMFHIIAFKALSISSCGSVRILANATHWPSGP